MQISCLARMILSGAITLALVSVATSQSSGWRASIVSASPEEPEYISGDNWPGRPVAHRWVKLIVELTSPGKDVKLPVAQIQLSNDKGNYPATAIAYQVSPKDSIVYLPLLLLTPPHTDRGMKESQGKPRVSGGWSTLSSFTPDRKGFEPVSIGFFEKMDVNKMLFNIKLKGTSGGRELSLVKSPLKVILLFAVPEGAANLQLRVGDAPSVAVPAVL
jgi:hypothetical protein